MSRYGESTGQGRSGGVAHRTVDVKHFKRVSGVQELVGLESDGVAAYRVNGVAGQATARGHA